MNRYKISYSIISYQYLFVIQYYHERVVHVLYGTPSKLICFLLFFISYDLWETWMNQDEIEDQILTIYRITNEKDGANPASPLLLREKHGLFLRKGLFGLSNAYGVAQLFLKPVLCFLSLHNSVFSLKFIFYRWKLSFQIIKF